MFAKPDPYRVISIAATVLLLSVAAEPGQNHRRNRRSPRRFRTFSAVQNRDGEA